MHQVYFSTTWEGAVKVVVAPVKLELNLQFSFEYSCDVFKVLGEFIKEDVLHFGYSSVPILRRKGA